MNGFIDDHELDGQVDSFQLHLSDGDSLVEQMGNLDVFFDLDDEDTKQLLESAYFAEKARIARRPDILQLGHEKLEVQLKVQKMARMLPVLSSRCKRLPVAWPIARNARLARVSKAK